MVTGKIIRFDEVKGYGFIAPRDGGEDVFVHANEITDRGLRVSVGTQVEFRVVESDRGLKAYDVRLAGEEQPAQNTPPLAADDLTVRDHGLPAEQTPKQQVTTEDELFEVFPEREFLQQITDLLLATAPQLTGTAILELRSSLVQFARKNGWVE